MCCLVLVSWKELVGEGSGESNKQQGGSGYEAGIYCMALDYNTENKSPETWELAVITQRQEWLATIPEGKLPTNQKIEG
jgi:hypothetical protein